MLHSLFMFRYFKVKSILALHFLHTPCCTLPMLHFSVSLLLSLFIFSSCCTFSCGTFSFCTFFTLDSFHVALCSCYTFFMLHFLHVALFSYCALSVLHSLQHILLCFSLFMFSSCYTFSCCTIFMHYLYGISMLHFFRVAFLCCRLFMLHFLHVAFFLCCTNMPEFFQKWLESFGAIVSFSHAM